MLIAYIEFSHISQLQCFKSEFLYWKSWLICEYIYVACKDHFTSACEGDIMDLPVPMCCVPMCCVPMCCDCHLSDKFMILVPYITLLQWIQCFIQGSNVLFKDPLFYSRIHCFYSRIHCFIQRSIVLFKDPLYNSWNPL